MEQTQLEQDRKKHEEYDEYSARMVRVISRPLAAFIVKYTSIHPTTITLLSIIPCLVAIFFLVQGGYFNTLLGATCSFLYLILDATDGPVARARNLTSNLGTWLDGIIGFTFIPLMMLATAIGLKSYLALVVGAIASLCFPLQFLFVHFYKSEVVASSERLQTPLPGKLSFLKKIYGAILFFPLLLLGAIFDKTLYVLIFFAVAGTFFWMLILVIEYLNLRGKIAS